MAIGLHSQTQTVSSIFNPKGKIIDAKARVLDEKEPLASPPKLTTQKVQQSIEGVTRAEQHQQQFIRNDTNRQAQQALTTYQSLSSLEERSEIQSLLGVDIFV